VLGLLVDVVWLDCTNGFHGWINKSFKCVYHTFVAARNLLSNWTLTSKWIRKKLCRFFVKSISNIQHQLWSSYIQFIRNLVCFEIFFLESINFDKQVMVFIHFIVIFSWTQRSIAYSRSKFTWSLSKTISNIIFPL
jgi:hypothetical protein